MHTRRIEAFEDELNKIGFDLMGSMRNAWSGIKNVFSNPQAAASTAGQTVANAAAPNSAFGKSMQRQMFGGQVIPQ